MYTCGKSFLLDTSHFLNGCPTDKFTKQLSLLSGPKDKET